MSWKRSVGGDGDGMGGDLQDAHASQCPVFGRKVPRRRRGWRSFFPVWLGVVAWLFGGMQGMAAIVLTLSGSAGSSWVTMAGSGSLEFTGGLATASSSSFLQLPDGNSAWARAGNNLGDYLGPEWVNSGREGRAHELSGDLRVEGSGESAFSYTFETVRLDDDLSPGGDDLDLRLGSVRLYPESMGETVVSLRGQAVFSLGDGNTFDDLVSGHYSLGGFGNAGGDSLQLVIQTIPEPSSGALALSALWCWFSRGRARKARAPET